MLSRREGGGLLGSSIEIADGSVRKRISESGGRMKLCDVTPDVIEVFEAVHLKEFFDFLPDRQAAIAALAN